MLSLGIDEPDETKGRVMSGVGVRDGGGEYSGAIVEGAVDRGAGAGVGLRGAGGV
jgi:hypothetical protein